MLMVNQLVGFGVGAAGGALTITPQSSASSGSDLTTYTFSAQAIGTASSDRIVIVAVGAANISTGTTLSSATIGGVAATIQKQQTNNAASIDTISAVITAAVPTGTTGDVVLTFSTGQLRVGISTFSLTGGSATASETQADTNGTDAVPDVTINVLAGGGWVGCTYGYTGTATATVTWAGTGVTEASDAIAEVADTFSAAYGNFASGTSALNVTATYSNGTITRQSSCGVSFSAA